MPKPESAEEFPVPEGWLPFGTHAVLDSVPPLEFSEETGEDGLPLWERREDR